MAETRALATSKGAVDGPPEATSSARSDERPLGPVRSRRRKRALVTWASLQLQRTALLAGVLIAWHFVAGSGLVRDTLAKGPLEVGTFIVEASRSGELWAATFATMGAVIAAFLLASVVGIAFGISLGLLPRLERLLSPFIDALNAMPRIALAPVFIIIFGIETEAKVALAFTVVVFILMSGAGAGIKSADPEVLRLSAVLGATRRQLFFKVMLPVATPAIFAALRLGLVYSLLGVVTSEIIASRIGLGQLIMRYSGLYQMEGVYGILIVLAILAVALNLGMGALERRLLVWRPPAEH